MVTAFDTVVRIGFLEKVTFETGPGEKETLWGDLGGGAGHFIQME